MKFNAFINKLMVQPIFREGLRFTLAGITTTVLLWGLFIVLVELISLQYLISVNIATLSACVYAFFINKYFVFRNNRQKHIKHFSKFVTLQLLLLGWTNLVLYLFVGHLGMHYLIVAIVNALLLVLINFLCQKLFIFNE